MPNPSGANQFANQPAYGDVKKLENLTRSAPMPGSGVTANAINAPRRGQKRVARGNSLTATAPAPGSTPINAPAPQVSYNAELSQVWNELLAHEPDNPLFQYYAQKTQSQSQ